MLPETAHGLTLDEWCAAFERLFIGTDVRIHERKVDIVTRERRLAKRKGLPESEEYCAYSMSRMPEPYEGDGWKGTSLSIEVSMYWEDGWNAENLALSLLRRHFHIRL